MPHFYTLNLKHCKVEFQVVVACQMVYEAKVIGKYDVPPLLAGGWEGFWGMSVLSTLLIPFYYIKVEQ